MNNNIPFRVIKGLEEIIMSNKHPIQEGSVYFATDTKKIYLDTNGSRLSMGGNTGIYYGKADFEGLEGPEFFFKFDDIEGENLPNINDLIINSDGCFYKVLEKQEDEFKTERITIAGSGGGGGNQPSLGSIKLAVEGGTYRTVLSGQPFSIQFTLTATDADGMNSGPGRYEIKINNVVKKTGVAENSALLEEPILNTVELGELFTLTGDYTVQVVCYAYTGGAAEASVSKRIYVNSTDFKLTWEYDDTTINSIDNDFTTSWSISGNTEDRISTIVIDDTYTFNLDSTSLTIPRQELISYGLTHGAHKFEIKASAIIGTDPEPKESNSIIKNIIFYDSSKSDYIVACDFFDKKIQQYSTIQLPIMIYHADNINGTAVIDFKVNSGLKGSLNSCQNLTKYVFAYTPENDGFVQLQFICGGTTLDLTLDVESLDLNITEVDGYEFKFKATEFTNNNEIQNWNVNGQKIVWSDNFDWINGGLKAGNDDVGPYFKVAAGSWLDIPYQMFSTDLKDTGACFKIIFKASNCRDYDASVAECLHEGKGLSLQAQSCSINSLSKTLAARYCEDTYIEYEFDICEYSNQKQDQYLTIWLDGIPAGVVQFDSADSFRQSEAKKLRIGSNDCDVFIYLIKFYKKHLDTTEHLNNFIVDAPNGTEMVNRFNRNDIVLKDNNNNTYISPELLAEKNKDCNVYIYEVPKIPTSKEDVHYGDGNTACCNFTHLKGSSEAIRFYTGVKLRAQGTSSMTYGISAYNLDAKFPEKWELDAEAIPVNYFNTKVNVASCEGANNALNQEWYNNYQPYKTQKRLQQRNDGKIARDTMEFKSGVVFIKDNNQKTNESVATANNIFKEIPGYVDSPYPRMYSIGNMGNSKKNIEVFHGAGNIYECCVENADNNTNAQRMIHIGGHVPQVGQEGDANYTPERDIGLNLPEELFDKNGFVKPNVDWGTTTIAETGEVFDNKTLWKNALINEGWFEFRYIIDEDDFSPNEEFNNYEEYQWELSNRFLRLVRWFAKNNPSQATGRELTNDEKEFVKTDYKIKGVKESAYNNYPTDFEVLKGVIIPGENHTHDTAEYRVAKMLRESENYLILDSILYHYLFIERHTMVDNVAKNTFWNTEDGIHWELTKDYDNDTADGVNNSGNLVFDYGMEVMDNTSNGAAIFNARPSAWLHFAHGLRPLREKMYQHLDAKGAWNPTAYLEAFETWQNAIPEICWIEDFNRKYFRPNNVYNDNSYLVRLANGKKTHQRKQYEVYQDQYMNSQYKTNTKEGNPIQWRSRQPADPSIMVNGEYKIEGKVKMYADGYFTAAIASGAGEPDAVNIHQRGKKGQVITFTKTQASPFDDATCYIYGVNLYQEFTNTEGLYPEYITATAANKLRKITFTPVNEVQKKMLSVSLSFGPNVEEIQFNDCQSINNAKIGLDLSMCNRLKKLNTIGSDLFTSYVVADGAPIEELKIQKPTALMLSNLRHLKNNLFNIIDYSKLGKIEIKNIDYNGINSKNIVNNIYTLNNGNTSLEYNLEEVNWQFDNNDNIENSTIPLLDYLLNKGITIGGRTKALSLTGKAKIPHQAYEESNPLSLYEKYGLQSSNDSTYPNLILDFRDNNNQQKLYTINIKNGDGKIVWTRQIKSFDNITNELLSNSALGGFDAAAAIKKSESNEEVYSFDNKWKYTTASGSGEIKAETQGEYYYLDLSKIQNLNEENIVIEPVYVSETRYYTVRFCDNNSNELYSIQATYRTPFNDIKPPVVPTKDDSSLPLITQTYYLKGYSAINGANTIINENTWQVTADVTLYTVFNEINVYKLDYRPYLNVEGTVLKGLKTNSNGDYIYQGQKIVIPKEITEIAAQAFGSNTDNGIAKTKLTKVFVENNSQLDLINDRAFCCAKLEYFEFVNSITQINSKAFFKCNLQSLHYKDTLILPSHLSIIGSNAFNQAFGTQKQNRELIIKIPSSVIQMRQYAIAHLESLKVDIDIGTDIEKSNLILGNANDKPIISSNGNGTYDICNINFYTNIYNAQTMIGNTSIREFFDDILSEKPGNINVSYIN